MPKKAGMESWKKKRRQEYMEKKEYRYYIFCEGRQTEPRYFEGFKKLIEDNPVYRDMVLIEIEPCQAETMRVIGMAERYVNSNKIKKGQIWCVYDKDSFPAADFNGVVHRAEQTGRCLVQIYKDNTQGIFYDNFQEFIKKLDGNVIVQKKVFVNNLKIGLEFICDDKYYIGLGNQFAKEYKCEFVVNEE